MGTRAGILLSVVITGAFVAIDKTPSANRHSFQLTTLLRGGLVLARFGVEKLSPSDVRCAKHLLGIKTTAEPRYLSLVMKVCLGNSQLYRQQGEWLQFSRETVHPLTREASLMRAERMSL